MSHTSKAATFTLTDLECGDCAAHLERVLGNEKGVTEVEAVFATARVRVVFNPAEVSETKLIETIMGLGYGIRPDGGQIHQVVRPSWHSQRRIIATVVAGIGFALGLVAQRVIPVASVPLFGLAILAGGFYMARAAWVAFSATKGLDINFLMVVAILGAIAIGRWEEAAEVACFFAAGTALSTATMDRTRSALRTLLSLAPPMATIRNGGRESQRPVESVTVGEIAIVRPGERIPLDGIVLEGQSVVDEAALTGESAPSEKGVGDLVFAGSMNGRGALITRVLKRFDEGALAKVVTMVETAQAERPPIQLVVDRFARVYTPAVLALAALVAVLPWVLAVPEPQKWVYQALALLVVACPCALVVASPVAMASGLATASRKGLLVKGGSFLEALGRARAVAFDKTGTLTVGRPVVTDVYPTDGLEPEKLVELAAVLEHRSEHPLGAAIWRKYLQMQHAENGVCPEDLHEHFHDDPMTRIVTEFEAYPGRGVSGTVDGLRVLIGSASFMADHGIATDQVAAQVEAWLAVGKTPVLIGEPGRLLGALAIADEVRPESLAAIQDLRAEGIGHIAMLTGDRGAVATGLSKQVGVDITVAEVLPGEKVDVIKALLAKYRTVIMVGDGINDAPALATASVGIAMGSRGSDVALESADVVLMRDDLRLVAAAVRLGRETMSVIKQNIVLSLAIKALLIGLAVTHVLTLAMAVLGDVGTTLLVVLNGMRLLRRRVNRS